MPVTRPIPNSGSSRLVSPDADRPPTRRPVETRRSPSRSSSPMPSTQETRLLQGSVRYCANCCKRCLNELKRSPKNRQPMSERASSGRPVPATTDFFTEGNKGNEGEVDQAVVQRWLKRHSFVSFCEKASSLARIRSADPRASIWTGTPAPAKHHLCPAN